MTRSAWSSVTDAIGTSPMIGFTYLRNTRASSLEFFSGTWSGHLRCRAPDVHSSANARIVVGPVPVAFGDATTSEPPRSPSTARSTAESRPGSSVAPAVTTLAITSS
ncbi:MAG: hypothetical protein U0183_10765 [Polyangiaceae bacterium]